MTAKNKCTHKITIKICTMSELTLVTFLHMLLALCKCKKWRISDVIFFLSKSTIQINQVIKQNVVHISMSKSDNKFLFFNNRNALKPGQDAMQKSFYTSLKCTGCYKISICTIRNITHNVRNPFPQSWRSVLI